MRRISLILLLFFFAGWKLSYSAQVKADSQTNSKETLKVAVLDSSNMSKEFFLRFRYENAYIAGIETAALAAKQQGISLQYRTFFYGDNPLDIFEHIPAVQAWQPDVILGPHYSNQFLLLKNYFPDTLVLSSYASDPSIKKLPNNFQSIFFSDEDLTEAINHFVQSRFKHKKVIIVVQADCKECMDMARTFSRQYQKNSSSSSLLPAEQVNFIGKSLSKNVQEKLVKTYQDKEIILLFTANYYLYQMLIEQVVTAINKPNLIFVTDVDDWGIKGVKGPNIEGVKWPYQAYRIAPLISSLDSTEKPLLQFNHLFFERYKTSTADSVSYMTFLTLMSALSALEEFPEDNTQLSMRQKVLRSYIKALSTDPNWFRSQKYAVYQYMGKEEVLVDTIRLPESKQ